MDRRYCSVKNGDVIACPFIFFHRTLEIACGAVGLQTHIFKRRVKGQLRNGVLLIHTDSSTHTLLVIHTVIL